MKSLFAIVAVVGLVFGVAGTASAQNPMWVGAGADVILPMGDFGDAFGFSYGGTALFQYDIRPEIAVGIEAGYIIYPGEDVTESGVTIERPNYSGVPARVFGKYYFMTNPAALRAYGKAGLGMFFGSVGDVEVGGVTYPGGSSSDFLFNVGAGIEYPITANGRTQLDASARYENLDGESTIGFRVGVNFRIN